MKPKANRNVKDRNRRANNTENQKSQTEPIQNKDVKEDLSNLVQDIEENKEHSIIKDTYLKDRSGQVKKMKMLFSLPLTKNKSNFEYILSMFSVPLTEVSDQVMRNYINNKVITKVDVDSLIETRNVLRKQDK